MKIKTTAALLAAMLLALSGCSELTVGSSTQNQTEEQIVIGESKEDKEDNSEEQEEAELDTQKIATELEGQGIFVEHWQDWDRETLPSQYLIQIDDSVLRLIEQVRNVTIESKNIQFFDGIEHANNNELLHIALQNTPKLHFDTNIVRDKKGKVQVNSDQYPNHILLKLLQNEQEEGRDIRELYYQEDVAAVYRRLFGSNRSVSFQDLCPKYYYYAREGVFARKGDEEKSNVWPMIVHYEEGENEIDVDLILTEGNKNNKPLIYYKEDGSIVELTADNYRSQLAGEPVYRYHFKKNQEGLMTIDGIRQVGVLDQNCQEIVDLQLPVYDEGPEFKMPERLTVSSGSVQSQIDLKKEYADITAQEYLMELLGKGQKVKGHFASKILPGGGSETTTLTLGYNEGAEKVVTVMSQGYLPGIEQGYMSFSVDSQQYILPQEEYTNLKACIESCMTEQ